MQDFRGLVFILSGTIKSKERKKKYLEITWKFQGGFSKNVCPQSTIFSPPLSPPHPHPPVMCLAFSSWIIQFAYSLEKGIFQIKTKHGVLRACFFEKPLEFFRFFTLPLEIPQTKQSFTPRNSTKLCYSSHKFEGLKPRTLGIPLKFFLITTGNSTLFLINYRKSHLLFFQCS